MTSIAAGPLRRCDNVGQIAARIHIRWRMLVAHDAPRVQKIACILGRRRQRAGESEIRPTRGPRVDPRVRPRERPRHPCDITHDVWFALFSALQGIPTKAPTKRPTKASTEAPTKVSSQAVEVHLSCFHLFCFSANLRICRSNSNQHYIAVTHHNLRGVN